MGGGEKQNIAGGVWDTAQSVHCLIQDRSFTNKKGCTLSYSGIRVHRRIFYYPRASTRFALAVENEWAVTPNRTGERGRDKKNPCSANHKQDWQPYTVAAPSICRT